MPKIKGSARASRAPAGASPGDPKTLDPFIAAPEGDPVVTALDSPAGRQWLADQLAIAELEEKSGPGAHGWKFNEGKRAEVTERLEFLSSLIALLEGATGPLLPAS